MWCKISGKKCLDGKNLGYAKEFALQSYGSDLQGS